MSILVQGFCEELHSWNLTKFLDYCLFTFIFEPTWSLVIIMQEEEKKVELLPVRLVLVQGVLWELHSLDLVKFS